MARTFRLRLCRPVVQKGKKLWRVYFSRYRFDRLRFTSPIVSRVSRSFSFAHAVILVYRTVHSSSLCVDKRSGIKKKKKKKGMRGKKKEWKKGCYIYENIYESRAFAHCTRPRGKIKTRCRGITRVRFIASCFHCLPPYDYLDTALTFDAWFRAAREPNIGDLSTNSP